MQPAKFLINVVVHNLSVLVRAHTAADERFELETFFSFLFASFFQIIIKTAEEKKTFALHFLHYFFGVFFGAFLVFVNENFAEFT